MKTTLRATTAGILVCASTALILSLLNEDVIDGYEEGVMAAFLALATTAFLAVLASPAAARRQIAWTLLAIHLTGALLFIQPFNPSIATNLLVYERLPAPVTAAFIHQRLAVIVLQSLVIPIATIPALAFAHRS